MSETTRFRLARIDNFSKAKEKAESLKEMPGVSDVNLGEDRWVTFVHDPSTSDTQKIRNRLEAMNLRIIETVNIKKRN
ncbi:hypothetical protein SUGI_0732990 [Cryptomeria japonica]|nr:hypothetical protein SUGI_0732990 [Cryptomeria japonica]